MKQAVIYTRVSSREQQQEGFSLGAQAKLLREYAKRIDAQIVNAFEDVETAKVSGRKQFSNMVTWFKRNRSCRILLVEKTDRLYRNFPDAVTLEKLDIEIHFLKENQIISKDSKSQERLMQGIYLVIARNYSENLREEVKKGMREKALGGVYPGHAPFGYKNNKGERTIEIDPVKSLIVARIFELYATARHSLKSLCKVIYFETGMRICKGNAHYMLRNPFYAGTFKWGGHSYAGTHPLFLRPGLFDRVQSVLNGHNRGRHSKREIAFRGMMTCAYCDLTVTGEVKKEQYTYYRCTGYHGKCDLPRFPEKLIADRLGEPLRRFQLPPEVVSQVVAMLREVHEQAAGKVSAERASLEARLVRIRNWMDGAYREKLEGTISEDFWERQKAAWLSDEQQVRTALQSVQDVKTDDRVPDAHNILGRVHKAYALYVSQDSAEKAKLLKMLLSSCSVDAVGATPTYREPFDRIFKGAVREEPSFSRTPGMVKNVLVPISALA